MIHAAIRLVLKRPKRPFMLASGCPFLSLREPFEAELQNKSTPENFCPDRVQRSHRNSGQDRAELPEDL